MKIKPGSSKSPKKLKLKTSTKPIRAHGKPQNSRQQTESLLEIYTDLYDLAPIGYFSVDEQGRILEANLTGATLLGAERGKLISQCLSDYVAPSNRAEFQDFLQRVFPGPGNQIGKVALLQKKGKSFWADVQASPATSLRGGLKWCRLAISDLARLKQAEEVRLRLEAMDVANRALKREILQRQNVQAALKTSEAQLRHLSRQLLLSQEEERKRISRELHDAIVQTLVGINVHLASLTMKAPVDLRELRRKISRTQRLVEKSVEIVHRFARELRPTVLDDLGLVPALESYIKEFMKRTAIRVHFTATVGLDQLNNGQRTVLYRVTQSALANVDKHAQATNVKVSIRKLKSSICLQIHDDGKSFEVERVLFAKRHRRLGLLGSRERVEMIGGKFSIDSAPSQGTTISAELPLQEKEKRVRGSQQVTGDQAQV